MAKLRNTVTQFSEEFDTSEPCSTYNDGQAFIVQFSFVLIRSKLQFNVLTDLTGRVDVRNHECMFMKALNSECLGFCTKSHYQVIEFYFAFTRDDFLLFHFDIFNSRLQEVHFARVDNIFHVVAHTVVMKRTCGSFV